MIPRSTILASSLRHLRASRRIPSTSPKSLRRSLSQAARPENNGPSSSTHASKPQGISAFGVVASMAIAAAMGYGASTLSTSNDAAAAPILDERRLPQVNYASLKDMEKEIQSLFSDVDGIISTDSDDLLAHGYSEWSSVNVDTLPVAVAYPRSTEHVSGIARICHKWKVPIIPFSGGSSVEGHISAPFGGVSIDFAYMDSIVKLNKEDMDVVVQPSVCWTDLNHELAKQGTGLWFPIDPAPSAKIGGMIGTNCSGTNAVRYGTMRDWVINMTVVLADGSVVKTRRRPRKCSAGYNLNGLIVGSEGTLGIVTEATLKLAAVPDHFSVAVVPFDDLRGAVSAAADIIRRGVQVAAVELMDETQMRIVNEGGATRPRVWKETPTLFLKFSGTKGTVDDNINTVREIMKPYSPLAFEFARDEHEQKMLWSARKESLYSLLAMRQDGEEMWNTDVAVPLSRLADIIEDSKAHAASLGLKACVKGHIGDSNFHENITYNKADPQEAERAKMAVKTMVKRALEMEGTCTGEHGVGIGKKDALLQEVGQDTIQVMKLLKGVLDPYWIMNPGKVFNR
ncbi:FAD-binding PCMH-type domain-containing protein [Fusarium falciforme]|uniref:FAD-binding PCMH-type domain-containing protein n=1 Tax=Fusarium falciforme TaxID=195108 RepID=UPI0023014E32|nr:FAD-binding PCMH-type domain-containing protein [Fusarium falciforme]WAO95757.1 FAD-binding PCMH-type domain-containing protein [Fusarium falciforme]